VVTVAHPDDESFGCGSVLAHARANGIESVVACATRGELGEVAGGVVPSGDLGRHREGELRSAAALLGVAHVEVLGWRDSGIEGEPEHGSLAAARPEDVEAVVAELVERVRPHVVVTLDASDGHRDHRVIRDATLAAVAGTCWRPSRTYLWCLPRSLMQRFTGDPTLGTPDEEITTVVDVRQHLDRRWRAMRAHASQAPPYAAMTAELQAAFLETDRLVRVDPAWTGGGRERDWRP
jgi:N-acetyl-1-D-myo-inositol-2-amino-2-deoxy-alpha-D-glucopyranoside deacetylase